jgi:hypothetical protein
MTKKETVKSDAAATLRALRRASDRAFRLAKETGTPFWVVKNGRMVNLNAKANGAREKK